MILIFVVRRGSIHDKETLDTARDAECCSVVLTAEPIPRKTVTLATILQWPDFDKSGSGFTNFRIGAVELLVCEGCKIAFWIVICRVFDCVTQGLLTLPNTSARLKQV